MSIVAGIVLPEGIALACDGRRSIISPGEGNNTEPGVEVLDDNCPKIHLFPGRRVLTYTGLAETRIDRDRKWVLERDTLPWVEGLLDEGASIREAAALLNENLADLLCGKREKVYCFALGGYDEGEDLPCLVRYADGKQNLELGIREDDMFQKGLFCMGFTDILNKVTAGEQLNFDNLNLESAINLAEFFVVLEIKCRTAFKGHRDCVGGRRFAAAVTEKQSGFVRGISTGGYRFVDAPAALTFADIAKEAQELKMKVDEALKTVKK